MAQRERRWQKVAVIGAALVLVLSGCIVDEPGIEGTDVTTQPASQATAVPETAPALPQFEPTVTSEPPTAVPEPTPTTEPTPAPTAVPAGPTPLPTSVPAAEYQPGPVGPGLTVLPVRGASFILAETHPVLQLGGHTLIYVDDELTAEVDIFTPVADRDANTIDSYAALLAYIESDAALAGLEELTPVSIAGFPTRVFEGTADSSEPAFITDLAAVEDDQVGWFPPVRMRLWVIDHPDGPVVVSAESLENPGRYSDAVRLATEVLSTIIFG